ncbi:MAG TPA: hypothetical protein PLV42_02295 [bacterium]|nr:hypothetical protein [bacterium]
MTKYFVVFFSALLFIAACSSDNSASDNENIPDELTPTDDTTATADDAIPADEDTVIPTDDAVVPTDEDTVIPTDGDEIITDEAGDDLLTDEEHEGGGDKDDAVVSDDDSVVADPVACCVEIVKEWWRCAVEVYKSDQATACKDCVAGLAACTDFLPLDTEWACAASCNDICPAGSVHENDDTVGKGLGQSRRAVATEYCTWMTDTACSYEPADFTGLGSTEPLSACF